MLPITRKHSAKTYKTSAKHRYKNSKIKNHKETLEGPGHSMKETSEGISSKHTKWSTSHLGRNDVFQGTTLFYTTVGMNHVDIDEGEARYHKHRFAATGRLMFDHKTSWSNTSISTWYLLDVILSRERMSLQSISIASTSFGLLTCHSRMAFWSHSHVTR